MPQDLLNLLTELTANVESDEEELGIGLDSCVIPLRHPGLSLVTLFS